MLIAHISDCHLRTDGRPLKNGISSPDALRACVDHLRSLEPAPEAVIVTGDLSHTGEPGGYQTLHEAFEELEAPVYVVPGNMDDREALRRGFADWGYLPTGGFLHYVVDVHPVRLIGLDTQKEGSHEGLLCAERLDWLEARLAGDAERPALIFMHHPPIGPHGFEGASEMEEIVRRHGRVARVAAGHLHGHVEENWGGTVASTAASVAFQAGAGLLAGTPPESAVTPDVCLLYEV